MSARRDAAPAEAKLAMEKLRAVREARGLGQREIAERTGVSHTTISRIENGHTDPQLSTVIRYLNALGMRLTAIPNDPSVTRTPDRARPGHSAIAAHRRVTRPTPSTTDHRRQT